MAASNLTIRLATAAVMVPLLLLLLFLGPAWGWLIFLLLIGVIGGWELFSMTFPGDHVARAIGIVFTWAVTLGIWFVIERPLILLTVMVLLPFASVLLALWRLQGVEPAALRLMSGTFGPMWLGAGLGCIALVRAVAGADGAAFVVFSLVLAWIGDTGAYFVGRAFGKHKLYEKVSPKKTVEGAIGGVLATIAGAVITRFSILHSLPIRDAVMLGAVGGTLGIAGDLGESLLKRSVGVKDSGGILPGHGGMLDRIDAVLITAPITLLYLLWIR
jgi:phosphatidate cytidylyltransferase